MIRFKSNIISFSIILFLLIQQKIMAQPTGENDRNIVTKECGVSYEWENIPKPTFSNWNYLSLFGSFKTGSLTFVPQINQGFRNFVSDNRSYYYGLQYQLDIYAKLSNKFYMIGSYSYSDDGIFPQNKLSLEGYQSISNGWGLSLGMGYMYFNNKMVSATSSIEKYVDKYWLVARATVTSDRSNNSVAPSFSLLARRFFPGEQDYIQLRLGYGVTVDNLVYFQGNSLQNHLLSLSCGLSVKKVIIGHLVGSAGISYRYEEYKDKMMRNVLGVQAGLLYRF